MIVYKLKNVLENKNTEYLIVCCSIRSQFITEAARDKLFNKLFS